MRNSENVPGIGHGTVTTLDTAYASCRRIAAEHGRTYYRATTLLTPPRRRAVHALYAFARMGGRNSRPHPPPPPGGGVIKNTHTH
ncbi:squalene/phytoene synthase family protein, partial [Nocardia sp. NPDC058497]|uniref:squalene/phytoene synthase family protein n=1 Tax=Nocardia sp. NPDC058497 TaxID=3346529 RepID=UPI00365A382A